MRTPSHRRSVAALTLATALLTPACTDSDNVSWIIISNPSAGALPVQGGLVVAWRYSRKDFSTVGAITDSGTPVALRLRETGGPQGDNPSVWRELYLGIDNDAVVTVEPGRTEIHSPAFQDGARTFFEAANVVPGPDEATALRIGLTTETIHVAVAGNLILIEKRGGVTAMRAGFVVEAFPTDSDIETSGRDYIVIEPSGRRTRIVAPPAGPVGGQAEFDPARRSYRFFSFSREFSAELPAGPFQVRNGDDGIRLDGDFPDGAGGAMDSPFRAILPSRNHHLLLLPRAR